MSTENAEQGASPRLAATALAAMGVVFGDIGTSPLYTMKAVSYTHLDVYKRQSRSCLNAAGSPSKARLDALASRCESIPMSPAAAM